MLSAGGIRFLETLARLLFRASTQSRLVISSGASHSQLDIAFSGGEASMLSLGVEPAVLCVQRSQVLLMGSVVSFAALYTA